MLQDFYKKILHKTKFNPHLHCQDNNMPGSSGNLDPKNGKDKACAGLARVCAKLTGVPAIHVC